MTWPPFFTSPLNATPTWSITWYAPHSSWKPTTTSFCVVDTFVLVDCCPIRSNKYIIWVPCVVLVFSKYQTMGSSIYPIPTATLAKPIVPINPSYPLQVNRTPSQVKVEHSQVIIAIQSNHPITSQSFNTQLDPVVSKRNIFPPRHTILKPNIIFV